MSLSPADLQLRLAAERFHCFPERFRAWERDGEHGPAELARWVMDTMADAEWDPASTREAFEVFADLACPGAVLLMAILLLECSKALAQDEIGLSEIPVVTKDGKVFPVVVKLGMQGEILRAVRLGAPVDPASVAVESLLYCLRSEGGYQAQRC